VLGPIGSCPAPQEISELSPLAVDQSCVSVDPDLYGNASAMRTPVSQISTSLRPRPRAYTSPNHFQYVAPNTSTRL